MRRVVLDAGALLTWFEPDGAHRAVRAEYEAGTLSVIGPRHLVGDTLGALASREGLPAERLARVGAELHRLGLQLQDPPVSELATWLAKGLPADRAAYPALASSLEVPLVTDDPELRRAAAGLLQPD
jgi:predicted nucleic acid-binding protein